MRIRWSKMPCQYSVSQIFFANQTRKGAQCFESERSNHRSRRHSWIILWPRENTRPRRHAWQRWSEQILIPRWLCWPRSFLGGSRPPSLRLQIEFPLVCIPITRESWVQADDLAFQLQEWGTVEVWPAHLRFVHGVIRFAAYCLPS